MMLFLTNILLLFPLYTFAYCNDNDVTVTLRNPVGSRIRGKCVETYRGETYRSFTNIPYAEPPIGKRRFQKPEPVQPWKGTYDATGVKRACLQDPIFQVGLIFGTEDCLVLNVYTPVASGNSSKLLPVLFWIPGGAFQFGSGTHIIGLGSFDSYDPAFFMEEDIVVVTLNYRLGALGFLTTHDDVIPANLGMRDQNLALRWVQENIDLFGGDPKDIVIAGQSAASCMTCYHLLSNGSEMEAVTGAIMISGTCLSPFGFGTNSSARANAFAVGRKLGLRLDESADDSSTRLLEVLQDVPAKKLLRMAGMRYSPHKGDEGQITPKWEPVFAKIWKMIDINVNVQDRVKAAEDMKVFYTDESFSEDPASVVKFCTDDEFTLPMGRHAESASKHGVPVYMYMVDHKYVPHFIPGVEGVGHGEDLYFFWNSTLTQTAKLLFPNFKLILRRMVRLLSNFVKYKKPIIKPDALFQNLEWPKFDSKNLLYLKIDSNLEVLSDMRDYSAKRAVYNKHIQKPISVY